MSHVEDYINESIQILEQLDQSRIERMIEILCTLKARGGRLFFLGVGGSAANCSHAVNDFRKLVEIESYTPVDNVAELTARTNDEGWHTVFAEYLKTSQLGENDGVFVLSVGGGNKEKNISANLVHALDIARERGSAILGIVGRDDGYTAQNAHACVVVPTVDAAKVTPHSEGFQGVIWHMIVSDPRLNSVQTKWESVSSKPEVKRHGPPKRLMPKGRDR
jgi:D-sedoheptulose 7-phosphate isomerase